MVSAYPPMNKGSRTPQSRFQDDDGFDTGFDPDVIRLLEENARLRSLVTQLSCIVLKHVVDRKD
jgi:hypothetical protein